MKTEYLSAPLPFVGQKRMMNYNSTYTDVMLYKKEFI